MLRFGTTCASSLSVVYNYRRFEAYLFFIIYFIYRLQERISSKKGKSLKNKGKSNTSDKIYYGKTLNWKTLTLTFASFPWSVFGNTIKHKEPWNEIVSHEQCFFSFFFCHFFKVLIAIDFFYVLRPVYTSKFCRATWAAILSWTKIASVNGRRFYGDKSQRCRRKFEHARNFSAPRCNFHLKVTKNGTIPTPLGKDGSRNQK